MPTRIDYWYDKDTPENTGWYIGHYGTVADMLANSPEDNIGPFESRAEAARVLAETTDLDDADERADRRTKPYDPSRDPKPASFKSKVQLELQQAEELRDMPPEVQGD